MSGITDPTEEYFKDGLWGWNGTQWRKLNLLFGYSGPYSEMKSNTNVPAGTFSLAGSTVPAGEIWVVYGMSGYVGSTSCNIIQFGFWNGDTGIICCHIKSPASYQVYDYQGTIVLAAGYYSFLKMYNATEGDDASLFVWGYKMKVT